MDLTPILNHDHSSDGNGDHDRQRRRSLQWNAHGEQGDGHEHFAKTQGGSDESRDKYDSQKIRH